MNHSTSALDDFIIFIFDPHLIEHRSPLRFSRACFLSMIGAEQREVILSECIIPFFHSFTRKTQGEEIF
jgi:hypothetical protein